MRARGKMLRLRLSILRSILKPVESFDYTQDSTLSVVEWVEGHPDPSIK